MATRPGSAGSVFQPSAQAHPGQVTAAMDRRNLRIFALKTVLVYLAAPVTYVGVVQAALCDKLGASATVANLPVSAYLLGAVAPLLLSWVIPHRLERAVIVAANLLTATLLAIVGSTLVLPFSDTVRIAAVVGQGLIQGFSSYVSHVYSYQCLGRGTTLEGRARALKLSYTFGPISAVVGSLGTHFVLNKGVPGLAHPHDFALLYFLSAPCIVGVALLSSRYALPEVKEENRQPFSQYMFGSLRAYIQERPLVLAWLAYVLFCFTATAMTNLSLYAKQAVGREPKELSGLIMALRFGFKSLGGFLLGIIALRWGFRAPLTATLLLVVGSVVWASMVPGYFYLLSVGLMGAGELGGAYFPAYVVTISSAATGARNLALLNLTSPACSVAPALHGMLTDLWGFWASFLFGTLTALASLWLVLKLPVRPVQGSKFKVQREP